VNTNFHGDVTILQSSAGQEALKRKNQSFCRAPQDVLGNLCYVEDLYVTNSHRLNSRVCQAFVTSAMNGQKKKE
ncbi:unnamed protein product, partial [Durusdinium trenchii]